MMLSNIDASSMMFVRTIERLMMRPLFDLSGVLSRCGLRLLDVQSGNQEESGNASLVSSSLDELGTGFEFDFVEWNFLQAKNCFVKFYRFYLMYLMWFCFLNR